MAERGEKKDADLVFPVISDVHIKRHGQRDLMKFRTAMDQLNRLAPHQDAVAVVGDLTNYGTEKEYRRFFNIFHDKLRAGTEALPAMGNHEYCNPLSAAAVQSRFRRHTGLSSIYYHRVIKGYHFIVMSPENRTKHGYYSDEQLTWLEERLRLAAMDHPFKPIFVFHHHPMRNTVYGSEDWGVVKNAGRMYEVLRSFPQVISFSGHSHFPLEDPRSIHQQDFTSVGTSSVSYMELEKGKAQGNLPLGHNDVSQGLLVSVYPNEVVIRRRSFQHDRWIGEPWIIPMSDEGPVFLYKSGEAADQLSFPYGASLAIRPHLTSSNRLAVSFPQASSRGGGFAHSYRISAVETRTQRIAAEQLVFSEFYKNPMPDSLTVSIYGLAPDTEYDIQVTAVDSYGSESAGRLKASGRTKREPYYVKLLRTLLLQRKGTASVQRTVSD